MDLTKVRQEEFPALEDKAFLDAACVSLAPRRAVLAVQEFARSTMDCQESSATAHHVWMDAKREKAYLEAASLLNADPEEIALVESTTHGLNLAATALRLPLGSKVITTSLEFLQVAMPWVMAQGVEVEVVPGRRGRFELVDFTRMADSRVRLIVLSSVQWCNGWRINLKELGDFCRERDIYLVVDAVQHIGAANLNMENVHVDIATAGGHKWLNSPFGCGLLYMRKELVSRIDPPFWGYLNLETPQGGWPTYFSTPTIRPVDNWRFTRTAKRFEVGGTSNYPGAIALGESLRLLNEIDIERVEQHCLSLADYCAQRLRDVGATVITHTDVPRENRSPIVVFRFYEDLREEMGLLEELHRQRVYVSMRFTSCVGGIRVSCHYFNNQQDIDRLISCLRRAGAKKAPNYHSVT